jgi:hypothetical protein
MRYLVIFGFVLLVLAAILLLIKACVVIEFKKNGRDVCFSVTFSAFRGILKYEYEIPLIDIGKDGIKFKRVKKVKPGTTEDNEGKNALKISEIFDMISSLSGFYKKNRRIICKAREYIRRKFIIKEYRLKVEAGTNDAFQTGILTGMLWTAAGMLSSYILNNFKAGKSCVDVKPAFAEEKLNVDFLCIFCAKIAHIIIVILMLYINHRRVARESKIRHKIGGGLVG